MVRLTKVVVLGHRHSCDVGLPMAEWHCSRVARLLGPTRLIPRSHLCKAERSWIAFKINYLSWVSFTWPMEKLLPTSVLLIHGFTIGPFKKKLSIFNCPPATRSVRWFLSVAVRARVSYSISMLSKHWELSPTSWVWHIHQSRNLLAAQKTSGWKLPHFSVTPVTAVPFLLRITDSLFSTLKQHVFVF